MMRTSAVISLLLQPRRSEEPGQWAGFFVSRGAHWRMARLARRPIDVHPEFAHQLATAERILGFVPISLRIMHLRLEVGRAVEILRTPS